MDIQKLFDSVKSEPDQPTIVVVVAELVRQGYSVTVNERLHGLKEVQSAEDDGQFNLIPSRNGFRIMIEKGEERQIFRVQLLDVDAICLTEVSSLPVIYDEKYTTGLMKSGKAN